MESTLGKNLDNRPWGRISDFLFQLYKEEPSVIFQVLIVGKDEARIPSRNITWPELSILGLDNRLNISASGEWNVTAQDLFKMINQVKGLLNYIVVDIDPKGT